MQTGTIKTLTQKGFGFISREGEAKDLFFHSKELKGVTFEELREGDKVTFEGRGSRTVCPVKKLDKTKKSSITRPFL